LWRYEELIYRATGGAAQNMSMADMIAVAIARDVHESGMKDVMFEVVKNL
jgi:hypothetical protein